MNALIRIALFTSLLIGGIAQAQFTSSVTYDGTLQEYLHRLDLFENYGNKEKLIDIKNQLVKFQHEHEDGTRTDRIFKLEIVRSAHNEVEFHVKYQSKDKEGVAEDELGSEINIDEAVESFLGFPLPKDHPLAGNRGERWTFNIDGQDQVEPTQMRSPVRFSIDNSGELKRIDLMSLSLTPEGFVGTMQAVKPALPINIKSMSEEEREEFVKEIMSNNPQDYIIMKSWNIVA